MEKKNTQLHYFTGSVLTPPVRPVRLTGQIGATWPNQPPVRPVETKLRAAHPALKCATRQIPNLRVSIQHFPPLCISADEFDAAGAEINVRVSCNKKIDGNKP